MATNMGIFMNTSVYPDMFKNTREIQEPNQTFFQYDIVSERRKEQQRVNEAVNTSIHDIKLLVQHQESSRQRGEELVAQQLQAHHQEMQSFKRNIMERLAMLEENDNKMYQLVESEKRLNKEAADQVKKLHHSNQKIVEEVRASQALHEKLFTQVEASMELQDEIFHHVVKQENQYELMKDEFVEHVNDQNKIKERLNIHEALLEKVVRQMDHFRSILYERTNYLAEKIEKGYKMTSSSIHQLISTQQKPYTFLMKAHKKEGKRKKE